MAYVYMLEMELKSEVKEEFVELAKRMLDYNREHLNHSFDVLIPETDKPNRVFLHRFNDYAEYKKLGDKQGSEPSYGEMQKELFVLLNDVKRTMYSTL